MGKHVLALDVPPVYNEGVLVIDDISIYDPLLGINCPTLQITYPGALEPVAITVVPGFREKLNACMIGLLTSVQCSDQCPCIPDGIYNIQYSVQPNDKVFVEYNHLRVTRTVNKWMQMLCNLDLQCCVPDATMSQTLNDMYIIRGYISTAVASVQNCHKNQDGINLLAFANSLLDKMSRKKPWC